MNDCCSPSLSRRTLLKAAGIGGVLTLGTSLMPIRAVLADAATSVPTDTLVVLSLRGGADWLSLVAPLSLGVTGFLLFEPRPWSPGNRPFTSASSSGLRR